MKRSTRQYFAVILFFLGNFFLSCKKDTTEPDTTSTGSFEIEFEHRVGNQPFVLNSQSYLNANGDDFKVNVFKYYVSNLVLVKDDGSETVVPETYFLIDASDAASRFQQLNHIPAGDYKAIRFTVGVDSLRNHSGAQTGALDPARGMFWTWNSGYIFLMFEGSSTMSTAPGQKLTFHIGGSKAPNNTVRTVTQNFNTLLRIRKDSRPELHFFVDVAALFKGVNTVEFSKFNFTMGGANAVIVADNYAKGMFRLDHIHN